MLSSYFLCFIAQDLACQLYRLGCIVDKYLRKFNVPWDIFLKIIVIDSLFELSWHFGCLLSLLFWTILELS